MRLIFSDLQCLVKPLCVAASRRFSETETNLITSFHKVRNPISRTPQKQRGINYKDHNQTSWQAEAPLGMKHKAQCCVTPGWDQGFGHSRISGYKQHFKEVFYSGIRQSRAKVQNGSIPRGSLVTHPNPSKNCTVLFSSKPIYGALRQETELPHQGLCFFWNWSKQLCMSTFQWVDTYWNTQQTFPIQKAVGSPSFKG